MVDEAYGDFIPREESILTELAQFSNLLVTRTFSKGFGLAGLRAGYILAAPDIIKYMNKATNPYAMNELSREAVAAAMAVEEYGASHAADFIEVKQALRRATGNMLTLLYTDDRIPICTLKHKCAVDLQELLYKTGVLTVSGIEFDGMDESCVRLRVPQQKDAMRLIQAVSKVDQGC